MKASRMICGLVAVAVLGLTTQPTYAKEKRSGGKRSIDVMTVNLYIGGDVFSVLALNPTAPDYMSNLVATVTTTFYEIISSQPEIRLQGVADAIAARGPDMVAVQEASLIRMQSPGDILIGNPESATDVVVDYLGMLVAALEARGEHYAVASYVQNMDVEMPMMNLQTGVYDDVRLTDRDAILVRTDMPHGQLHVTNPQNGNFSAALPIPSIGLTVPRGWCSVDAFVRGRRFRFICAHPEIQLFPSVQMAQVAELLSGPANVDMSVIIAGDFNTDPLGRDGTATYGMFGSWGFKDAWAESHPFDPAGGLTWGHDEFLADPYTDFIWRLDLVLYKGKGIEPANANVLDMYLNRTDYPLWASDHAALQARFRLK